MVVEVEEEEVVEEEDWDGGGVARRLRASRKAERSVGVMVDRGGGLTFVVEDVVNWDRRTREDGFRPRMVVVVRVLSILDAIFVGGFWV